jgi:MFS family permease
MNRLAATILPFTCNPNQWSRWGGYDPPPFGRPDQNSDPDYDDILFCVFITWLADAYNVAAFGLLSILAFPGVFFTFSDPIVGVLYACVIFVLAFVMRPAGAVFFARVERGCGHGIRLTAALFLLSGATVAVTFLPDFDDLGVASVVLLGLFRIGQGVALGGVWDGVVALLVRQPPERHRSWYIKAPRLGGLVGLGLAISVVAYFLTDTPSDDFMDWGWRYPLLVGAGINMIVLVSRLRIIPFIERLHPAPQPGGPEAA